jgi:hypothetical protein
MWTPPRLMNLSSSLRLIFQRRTHSIVRVSNVPHRFNNLISLDVVNGEKNSLYLVVDNKSELNSTLKSVAGSFHDSESQALVKNVRALFMKCISAKVCSGRSPLWVYLCLRWQVPNLAYHSRSTASKLQCLNSRVNPIVSFFLCFVD